MTSHPLSRPLLALLLLAGSACGTSRSTESAADCTGCHKTSGLTTGAHAAHLVAGTFRAAVACSECHVVPTSSAHAASPLAVSFATGAGDLAAAGDATPAWNATTKTCSGVYCHGAAGSGGTYTAPVWTAATGSVTCSGCHALPPAGGHVQVSLAYCSGCHNKTVNKTGALLLANGTHLDGQVQFRAFAHPLTWGADHQGMAAADAAAGCKPCHGDDLRGGTSGASCYTCHPTGPAL